MATTGYVIVKFTCNTCGASGSTPVKARRGPDDPPLMQWMERVRAAVAIRHTFMNLFCEGRTCDLLIPAPKDGNGWVGREE